MQQARTSPGRGWRALTGSLVRRLAVVLAASAVALPASAGAPPPSRAQVRYDLALSLAMRADERFLAGDPKAARDDYARAAKLLDELGRGPVAPETVALLRADVAYRTKLLDAGLPFWGTRFALRPSVPFVHLNQLNRHVDEFKALAGELATALDKLGSQQIAEQDVLALSDVATSEVRIQELERQRIDTLADVERRGIERARDRIQAIQGHQKRLRRQQEAALEAAEKTAARLEGLVVDAVGRGLGLPVDISAVQGGQPLGETLLQAGASALGQPDSPLSRALGEHRAMVRDVIDLYDRAKEVKQQIDEGKQTLGDLKALVREPSLARAMALGEQALRHVPASERKRWEAAIGKAKPFVPLVELALSGRGDSAALRKAVGEVVGANADVIWAWAERAGVGDLSAWAARIVARLGDVQASATERLAALRIAVAAWPERVVDALGDAERRLLIEEVGVANREQLVARLVERGLTAIPAEAAKAVGLRYDSDKARVQALLTRAAAGKLDAVVTGGKARLLETLRKASSVASSFTDEAAAVLRSADVEAIISAKLKTELGTSDPSAIGRAAFDRVLAKLSGSARADAVQHVAQAHAGMAFAAASAREHGAASAAPEPAEDRTERAAAGGGVLESALSSPLAAAVPGGAWVQLGLKIVDGIGATTHAYAKVEHIGRQIERYTAEEANLRDLVETSRVQLDLADIDRRVAERRRASALSQLRRHAARLDLGRDLKDRFRARIADRLAHLFYLAEKLRYDFDALERSLALWAGHGRADGGELVDRLARDPNNLRLVLDPSIHLFSWLQRSLGAQRVDIEALALHWRRVKQVASDLFCTDASCTQYPGLLGDGDVGRASFSLSQLANDAELQELRRWQQDPNASPTRRIGMFVHPGRRLIDPELEGVRVVDVFAEVEFTDGTRGVSNLIGLAHPGVGHVRHADRYHVETLAAPPLKPGDGLDRPAAAQSLQFYRTRFSQVAGLQLRTFEGYPFYTTWEVQFRAGPGIERIKDVHFQIVYQHTGRGGRDGRRERACGIETFAGQAGLVQVDQALLATLGPPSAAQAKLAAWSAGSTPAGLDAWRYGPARSPDAAFWSRQPPPSPLARWLSGMTREAERCR